MSNDSSDAKSLDQEVEEMLGATGNEPAQDNKASAHVVQLHKMRDAHRGRGRPRKPDPMTADALVKYHAELARQQAAHIDNDPLVQATHTGKESAEMLRLVRQRLARIQAALEFRRIEDERVGGKESANILRLQTGTLRELAAIELKIKEMGVDTLDLRGEPMQKVFSLLVSRIQGVASDVLPKAQFDLFFNQLETALEGWEDEAESLLR